MRSHSFRAILAFSVLCGILGCGTSTETLSQQAKSADPGQRLHAVHALRERNRDAETVVPVLVAALGDEDKFVRRDAARALAQFGAQAKPAVPALQGRLSDRQPSVRKAAEAALREIDPSAVPKTKKR